MRVCLYSPLKCMMCEQNACYEELPICIDCLHEVQTILTARCRTCGLPPSGCSCYSDSARRFLFFFGSPESKWFMYRFKTNADRRIVRFVAEMLVKSTGINPKSYDGITYVPRSRKNRLFYGYDQSRELAKEISRIYSIPLVHTLKRKGGEPQKLLSAAERRRNMSGRFTPINPPRQKYNKLLLVDDICTTGATVDACSDLLRQHFSKSVTALVISKTNFLNKNKKTII